MLSTRGSAEHNAQRSDEALKFAEVFFNTQDKEKQGIHKMYHDRSTLIWNGEPHHSKTNIAKFYEKLHPTQTTLQSLDAQILPQMGDILDNITVVAGGKINNSNFSRAFLLGPNAPGSTEYLIVSDTMRTYD